LESGLYLVVYICLPCTEFEESLKYTLEEYGNINFYMFHGGTNFAFMNGANEQTENDQLKDGQDYLADVTSYGELSSLLEVYEPCQILR